MKVTESNPLAIPETRASATPAARPASVQAAPNSGHETQVHLAPAAQSVFGDRTERVAHLQQLVDSGNYKPKSQSTSEKLVSGALSRPE
jgi:hypothetical protein